MQITKGESRANIIYAFHINCRLQINKMKFTFLGRELTILRKQAGRWIMDLQNIQRFVLIKAFWIQRQNLYSHLILKNKETHFHSLGFQGCGAIAFAAYISLCFSLIFSCTSFWYVTNMRHQKKYFQEKYTKLSLKK